MCKRYIHQLPLTHPQLGTWPTTQACALTGNRTSDPLVGRPALNPLNHTSQGLPFFFFNRVLLLLGVNEQKNQAGFGQSLCFFSSVFYLVI